MAVNSNFDGTPLASLYVFQYVHTGAIGVKRLDSVKNPDAIDAELGTVFILLLQLILQYSKALPYSRLGPMKHLCISKAAMQEKTRK